MGDLLILQRRGFIGLLSACRAKWGGELEIKSELEAVEGEYSLIMIARHHPDAFRGVADSCRRRWPGAEIWIVDGPWGISARRTRPGEPPGWVISEVDAIARIRSIAVGACVPSAQPWTLTCGERVANLDSPETDWPHADPPGTDL